MSWNSIALIVTNTEWQYTEAFEGDYIRVRHLLGAATDDLPFGFTGLYAQAFDFANTVELYAIRKLYPFNAEDILELINPLPTEPRRLAIRGQRKYQTKINWRVQIEVWTGSTKPDFDEVNNRLTVIESKVDEILERLGNGNDNGGGTNDSPPEQQQFIFFR